MEVGETVQFHAEIVDKNGHPMGSSPSVVWSVSLPGIASIGADGLALGLAEGQTSVTAALGSVSGRATLDVVEAEFTHATVLYFADSAQ